MGKVWSLDSLGIYTNHGYENHEDIYIYIYISVLYPAHPASRDDVSAVFFWLGL